MMYILDLYISVSQKRIQQGKAAAECHGHKGKRGRV